MFNNSLESRVSLFLLRFGLGWLFFYAGWEKVVTFFTPAKDWTAAGFLKSLEGPFANFFAPMAGNNLIDQLNAWGLLLVGIALLIGILVRWSSFWGIVIMGFYWLASFPAEHSFVVEDHIIYIFALLVVATFGAGRFWGVDGWLETRPWIRGKSLLRKFLG